MNKSTATTDSTFLKSHFLSNNIVDGVFVVVVVATTTASGAMLCNHIDNSRKKVRAHTRIQSAKMEMRYSMCISHAGCRHILTCIS